MAGENIGGYTSMPMNGDMVVETHILLRDVGMYSFSNYTVKNTYSKYIDFTVLVVSWQCFKM